jgi:hypothetical protein
MVGKTFALELVMRLSLRRLIVIAALLAPNLVHAYDFALQFYLPPLFGQVSGERGDPDKPGAKLWVFMPMDLRVYVARTERFALGVDGGVSFVLDEDDRLKTVYSYGGFTISHITISMETGDVEYDWYLTVFPLYEFDFLRPRYKAAVELGWYFLPVSVPDELQEFIVEMSFSAYTRMVFFGGSIPVADFGLAVAMRIYNNRLPRINPRRE